MNMIQNQLFIDGEFVDAESKARIPVLNPHDNSLITEVAEAQKADIDRAVEAARRAFPAWSKMAAADRGRLLLKLADAIEANADELARLESLDTGHPMNADTEMGPLTSQMHRDRVLAYVKVAKEQGGEILLGGKPPERDDLSKGCYFEPTVVRAKPTDRVSQEEVFGPFVTVTTFRDDDEVLAIANGTDYGLGGGLWTTNLQRAHRTAAAMRSGMVWINCYKRVNPGSPFGGIGRSGYGREMGFEAMQDYTEAKSVWVNVDAKIPPYYPR
jgi:acyl-CoA reductase-like NAD-dependent aldehyde dehydrogenase